GDDSTRQSETETIAGAEMQERTSTRSIVGGGSDAGRESEPRCHGPFAGDAECAEWGDFGSEVRVDREVTIPRLFHIDFGHFDKRRGGEKKKAREHPRVCHGLGIRSLTRRKRLTTWTREGISRRP